MIISSQTKKANSGSRETWAKIYLSTIGELRKYQRENQFGIKWVSVLLSLEAKMEKITIDFDTEGDIFYVEFCKPYRGQGSTEIDGGVVARTHPITGRIESLEIMDVSARNGKLELPMIVEALEMAVGD
jgi:hypothetical protein